MTEGTVSTAVAGIWRFKQFWTYFRLIPVAVFGALGACDRANSFGTGRHRTVSRIVEYAFLTMHTFHRGQGFVLVTMKAPESVFPAEPPRGIRCSNPHSSNVPIPLSWSSHPSSLHSTSVSVFAAARSVPLLLLLIPCSSLSTTC